MDDLRCEDTRSNRRFADANQVKHRMDHRFFCPQLSDRDTVILEGAEAHHLVRVLRASVGKSIELFDGQGTLAAGTIQTVGKHDARLLVTDRSFTPAPPPCILAAAVPKGERFDWLVEKATELGVTTLIPLRTERGVVDPRDSKLDRLRQVVIEACKQSRRPWLMTITPPCDWPTLLNGLPPERTVIIADPSGTPWLPGTSAGKHSRAEIAPTVLAVGPEGGWTAAELDRARSAGAEIVTLGDTILRIETAAVTMAAAWKLVAAAGG